MKVLEHLKYTEEHEWVKTEGDIAIIGITDYAQSQLGDVVFVDINTVGETLFKGEVVGTIEAVKTVSDIYMPVSGEILEFNEALSDNSALLNSDPYEAGWIVKVRMNNPSEVNDLLDGEAYKAVIG